jgi:hypothetical protein
VVLKGEGLTAWIFCVIARRNTHEAHGMALDESALIDLLEALKLADVDERGHTATEHLYQALIGGTPGGDCGAPHDKITGVATGVIAGLVTTRHQFALRFLAERRASSG